MKILNRIQMIVELTIEDVYNYGKSSTEEKDQIVKWVINDLMKEEFIEEYNTIEVSIKVLEKIHSLEIINLGFIIETLANDNESAEMNFSLSDTGYYNAMGYIL